MVRAVILIGGKGERLMPLTQNIRKAFLPLGEKRVIDHIIDRLPKGMPFSISENDSGAMAALSEVLIGNEPVMVICGDNYFSDNLDGLIEAFKGDTLVGIYDIRDKRKARNYGVVEVYGEQIIHITEKPLYSLSTLVSTGLYTFPPRVFPCVHRFAEVNPTANLGDLIEHIILFAPPVYSYRFRGLWLDIGTRESYEEAIRTLQIRGDKFRFCNVRKRPITPYKGQEWCLRKKDGRYEIYDLELEDFTLSITYLNQGKATTGHSHTSEEVYYFAEGWGRLTLGQVTEKIEEGDIVVIPGGEFHRVFNDECPKLVFLSVFTQKGS